MKRIELYVNEQHFVIEECEGRPEIRHVDQPRVMADRKVYASIGQHGITMPITLRVESGQ